MRWILFITLLFFLLPGMLFVETITVQAETIYDLPILIPTIQIDELENPDHMLNLIIGAAAIVLVIFVGVVLRRPKS
jgi:hypothetical protein